MTIKILPHDLKGEVKKRSGFSGLNPGKVCCTPPWSSLQHIGRSTFPDVNSNYTGEVPLAINQGGVRNRNISKYSKALFKTEVFPAIKKFEPKCGDTFHLLLHFREGLLSVVELEYS
jgi:hypothetical protein